MRHVMIIIFGVLLGAYVIVAIEWGIERLIAKLQSKKAKKGKDRDKK